MRPFLGGAELLVLLRDRYGAADPRHATRAAAVAAVGRGEPVARVARAHGCSRSSVYEWVRLYQEHRDAAALSRARSPAPAPEDLAAAAEAVNALSPARGKLPGVGARLGARARAAARRDSRRAEDPAARLRAAIAWALARGVPVRRVARAAGRSPQAVYQALDAAARGD